MQKLTNVLAGASYGVIDPTATERRDTKFLDASLSRGDNIMILPQGPRVDRGGTTDFGRARLEIENIYETEPTNSVGNSIWPVLKSIDLGSSQDVCSVDISGFFLSEGDGSTGTLTLQYYDGSSWQDFGNCPITATSRTRRLSHLPGTAPFSAESWRISITGPTDTRDVTYGKVVFWKEIQNSTLAIIKNFSFEKDTEYKLIITQNNVDIFKAGVWQGSAALPISEEKLRQLQIAGRHSSVIFTQQNMQPHQLLRQGADDQWQCSPIEFENIPKYDFGDPSAPDFLPGVTEKQRIQFPTLGANNVLEIYVEGEQTENVTFTGTAQNLAVLIKDAIEDLSIIDEGLTVTYEAVREYSIEFTGGNNAERPWPLINILNASTGQQAVITEVTAGKIPGAPVMSDYRGWPGVVRFMQERALWMGFPLIPNGFLASVTGSPFDADTEIEAATGGFFYEIDAGLEQTLRITDAIVGSRLIVIGDNGLAYLRNQTLSKTEVPEFLGSDAPGIKPGTKPILTDGRIVYVESGGETINTMNYSEIEQNFLSENSSLLSAFLIKNPVSIDIRPPTSSLDSFVIFTVMSDGSMVPYFLMRNQKINGFVPHYFEGKVVDVSCGSSREVWLAVEHDNQGNSEIRIEKMDFEGLLDSAIDQVHEPASNVIQGLERFNGKAIWVIGDDQPQGPFTVSNGQVSLDEAVSKSRSGFWQPLFMEDHDVYLEEETRSQMARLKRIYKIDLSLLNTNSIAIQANGGKTVNINLDRLDQVDLDKPLLERKFTGLLEVEGMPGFTPGAKLGITQTHPGKLCVRSQKKHIIA